MSYRILIFDKSEEDCKRNGGSHELVKENIQAMEDLLRCYKYEVSVITELDNLTDALYRDHDCVVAHPTAEKAVRLSELHKRYPGTGLIISAGDSSNWPLTGDANRWPMPKLAKDVDGVYILEKPFTPDELFDTINAAVRDAKNSH
jgi:hypothetical protein